MTTCAVVTAFGLFCLGFTALLAIGSLMGMFMKSRFEAVERARARRQDLAEWQRVVDEIVWRDDRV